MLPEEEKQIVEKAKSSAEAFGLLYDEYFDAIFGYCLRRTADIDTAKDITSTVFFKALKSIRKYRWQGVPFSHWLYRIAGNEIIDHYRNKKRETNYEEEMDSGKKARVKLESGSSESGVGTYDDYLDLHHHISQLSPHYQEVITLKYFEDLSINNIADILQKPEGTVKSLLHRAIGQLRVLAKE